MGKAGFYAHNVMRHLSPLHDSHAYSKHTVHDFNLATLLSFQLGPGVLCQHDFEHNRPVKALSIMYCTFNQLAMIPLDRLVKA